MVTALPPGAKAWFLLDWDGVLDLPVSNARARELGLRRFVTINSGFRYVRRAHVWLDNLLLSRHPHLAPGWATAWYLEANHELGNRIHLGPWPAANLGYYCEDPRASKIDGILALVGDAPFVWVDDDPTPGDDERLAGLPQPALLIRTDESVGIRPADLERASAWAASLPDREHA